MRVGDRTSSHPFEKVLFQQCCEGIAALEGVVTEGIPALLVRIAEGCGIDPATVRSNTRTSCSSTTDSISTWPKSRGYRRWGRSRGETSPSGMIGAARSGSRRTGGTRPGDPPTARSWRTRLSKRACGSSSVCTAPECWPGASAGRSRASSTTLMEEFTSKQRLRRTHRNCVTNCSVSSRWAAGRAGGGGKPKRDENPDAVRHGGAVYRALPGCVWACSQPGAAVRPAARLLAPGGPGRTAAGVPCGG
jgi:hypothetical protein